MQSSEAVRYTQDHVILPALSHETKQFKDITAAGTLVPQATE